MIEVGAVTLPVTKPLPTRLRAPRYGGQVADDLPPWRRAEARNATAGARIGGEHIRHENSVFHWCTVVNRKIAFFASGSRRGAT